MILPMGEGSIEVVNRNGDVSGHGFVWQEGGETLQEWILYSNYPWPPVGAAEFRAPAGLPTKQIGDWRSGRKALWKPDAVFVSCKVDRREQVYPLEWPCVILMENRLVGFASASIGWQAQYESTRRSGPLRLRVKERWFTSKDYQPPPQSTLRIAALTQDLFVPVGQTPLEFFKRCQETFRLTTVLCELSSSLPGTE